MNRPIVQAVILVLAAFVLGMTANALASRQRKVTWVGWYPNATRTSSQPKMAPAVAAPVPAPMTPAPAPVTTTTMAPAPAPVVPTTTTQAPKPAVKPPTQTANSQPPTAKPSPSPDKFATPHPDKPYIEIAYDDVKALHDKDVLFLDARRTSVYEQGHIAGARPFSVWESDIDEKVNKFFDERSTPEAQALPIVVYCSGGDCEDSHMLAQKLWGIQFNNVYVYKDGFPDWQKKGGAIHTGAQP